jgi:hypothetical protein
LNIRNGLFPKSFVVPLTRLHELFPFLFSNYAQLMHIF